jgi:RNA polymerase sigma-70 factor (ECF subfamily)
MGRKESLAQQDDDQLVEAARTDREAFGVLYDRYFDTVYNYVYRRVGDHEAAEDITGAVWERALGAIEKYEVRGYPFAAWLYRIAGNLVSNHHRRRAMWRLVPFSSRHARPDPRDRLDQKAAVRSAMTELSESDQEVLGLYYFAGLTPPEIGDVLGCKPAAVHKRLHRARERLKKHLEDYTGDESRDT